MDGSAIDEEVRVAVYRGFATTGAAPTVDALAVGLGTEAIDVTAALARLAEARHVVLDDAGNVVMAHPFASVPLGFSVMGPHTLWWGGCAWDSFALPHLLSEQPHPPSEQPADAVVDVLVATRCPGCDRALAWVVGTDAPPAGDELAHFLVPVAHIWDDVVHTCGHQRLFCGEECIAAWLRRSGNERGYVMDLAQLWRLARSWYSGRLDHGYTRRDPSTAADYFREVGLRGAFWGLDA